MPDVFLLFPALLRRIAPFSQSDLLGVHSRYSLHTHAATNSEGRGASTEYRCPCRVCCQAWAGGQVPVRSRRACAVVVSVAVGCASNRRRSIGSPVSSQ